MIEKIEFIGGTLNGQHREISNPDNLPWVEHVSLLDPDARFTGHERSIAIKREWYERRLFETEQGKRFYRYVLEVQPVELAKVKG